MAYLTKGNPHKPLPREQKKRVKKDGSPVEAISEKVVDESPELDKNLSELLTEATIDTLGDEQ